MKIQSISLINNINKNYKTNNITQTKLPNLPYDSVSFKGRVLTYEELRPLKLRAWQVQNESIEHKKEAQSTKDEAYEKLAFAKNEFLQALKYCNYFKKNPSKTSLELKNGNNLNFQFEFKNGRLSLEIEETNQDGAILKTISALDFVPVKIVDFSSEEVDVYEFKGNSVAIIENLGIDGGEFGTCDKFTTFRNGQIYTISQNGNVSKMPSEFNETYVYFDDKLMVCSLGNTVYPNGACASDERYVFVGESFSTYYSGFKGDVQGAMSFDESLHFEKGNFIGSILDGKQAGKNQDIISNDATFLNSNKEFIHSKNCHACLSDFGLPIFSDCE